MGKKLIFLDIDGTLVEPGSNTPPASALEAIRRTQEKGNLVFLCTGRNCAMLEPLLHFGFDGMVAGAGGFVTVGDEVIFDCPMTKEQTETAISILHRDGVFCTLEAKDATWGDENLGEFLAEQGGGNSEIERWRKALSESLNILPMKEYDGRPVYKIVIMCMNWGQLDAAKEALEKDFAFCIQDVPAHGCLNGELINRAYDKGRGVLRICEHLGVPVSDTYGFGDSMNDREMIETVGTSVCMENGSRTLKELSDLVCPSVTDDGLYKAFLQLGLI